MNTFCISWPGGGLQNGELSINRQPLTRGTDSITDTRIDNKFDLSPSLPHFLPPLTPSLIPSLTPSLSLPPSLTPSLLLLPLSHFLPLLYMLAIAATLLSYIRPSCHYHDIIFRAVFNSTDTTRKITQHTKGMQLIISSDTVGKETRETERERERERERVEKMIINNYD